MHRLFSKFEISLGTIFEDACAKRVFHRLMSGHPIPQGLRLTTSAKLASGKKPQNFCLSIALFDRLFLEDFAETTIAQRHLRDIDT